MGQLKTPPGTSEYQMWRDDAGDPPAIICQVGGTQLKYDRRAIDDLHAMLKAHGDWMPLGGADEQKPAPDGIGRGVGSLAGQPDRWLVRAEEGPARPVRRVHAAAARGARAGRGHPRREEQPDARDLSQRPSGARDRTKWCLWQRARWPGDVSRLWSLQCISPTRRACAPAPLNPEGGRTHVLGPATAGTPWPQRQASWRWRSSWHPRSATGATHTYVILYSKSAVPAGTQSSIAAAGGTLVASVRRRSASRSPARTAPPSGRPRPEDAGSRASAATARFAVRLATATTATDDASAPRRQRPATDTDSLSGLQWDMVQIHAPEAHAITGGSPSVVVGDIDTGLDYTHPDLAANVDFANSANCLSGAPVQGTVAANDDNGHGTHTAGTIAAASNGIGIVGVAPNVKIAGIKAGNADGFFFPEAVVCAFMWAGTHHIHVTNNSYFADPWLFNCRTTPSSAPSGRPSGGRSTTPSSRASWSSPPRATRPTTSPTRRRTPPARTTPTRCCATVHNDCAVVPAEVAGVVGVTANGNLGLKSFYSSYGVGDGRRRRSRRRLDPAAHRGRAERARALDLAGVAAHGHLPAGPAGRRRRAVPPTATSRARRWRRRTSAGVAALIKSRAPELEPGAVSGRSCRTPPTRSPAPPTCRSTTSSRRSTTVPRRSAPGGTGYNSFNGHGQVNALTAVSK